MPARRSLLLLLACLPTLAQTGKPDTYVNARFNYSVEYPRRLLVPQGESGNGDGQVFQSKDKRFRLIVWGVNNALDHTLSEHCEWTIDAENKNHPFRPTYKVVKSNWFVMSGLVGDTIIYEKTFLDDGMFKTVRLEYPGSAKNEFDPLVKQIVASFRTFHD